MAKLSLAKLERHLYAAADLLRGKADYQDYILGMLFLKRCSDVFEAERTKLVEQKTREGIAVAEAEERYGENQDFYDSFFVPVTARWGYLTEQLNTPRFADLLNRALSAMSAANPPLQNVLAHINFLEVIGNKRVLSDEDCRALFRHFDRYRLRTDDFQFTDLIGAAYEFLINTFAERGGKKGGEDYTPRDVVRLMVRLIKPQAGMAVYDPCCGSGGMLIISREYVEQSGGDPHDLRLCGQERQGPVWAMCKINMLLHGIPDADIQQEDTLLHPLHRERGELERFDRVIANPPFSQNYTREGMEFRERFRWGWCPTTGKKGDLMFAQHMLAMCKPTGMVVTVMPHGVLFRGNSEKDIRQKLVEQDLIEAIISLPQNLFYGSSIPACLLVMRPETGRKPAERRNQILFINADAEYHTGRAQNYIRPDHIEKIASTFERYVDIPGYSRRVSLDEIRANDFNLNVRRYVDNSPPTEPHDVRAHLLGGVPVAEIEAMRPLCEAMNFDPAHVFAVRAKDPRYADFAPDIAELPVLCSRVEEDEGIARRTRKIIRAFDAWWLEHSPRIARLPRSRDLNRVRAEMLDTFVEALLPGKALDRFDLAGVIASWWNETLPDFKTLIENGFAAVMEGWLDAVADALEDDDQTGPIFDPFAHKLVRHVMADYLEQMTKVRADVARFKTEKEEFEQSNPPEDADEEELKSWNYAKDLARQIKELRAERREDLKELVKRECVAAKKSAAEACKQALKEWQDRMKPVLDELSRIETALAPYGKIKEQLAEAKARYRALVSAFLDELRRRCAAKAEDEKQALVMELMAEDLRTALDAVLASRRKYLVGKVTHLWDKYRVTLAGLRDNRVVLEERLPTLMKVLGYS